MNDSKVKQNLIELEHVLKEWNSTLMGRRSFLKAMPLLLASCGTTNGSRYREGDNKGQNVTMTPADEKRMSAQVLPKMKQEYPPVNDRELQTYIAGLGQKVVQANGLTSGPYSYTFQAVASKQVNAFALPAGPVFITTPLIAMADTEAELVGVIGHEIGHIKARHTAERMYKVEKSKGKSMAMLLGGGVVGGVLGYGLGKLICSPKDTNCKSKALQLGAGAGAAGGALISKFGFMANSREDEMEADRIGFKTSVAAGYSKDHVGNFYEKLLMMEQNSKSSKGPVQSFTDALSTHPPSTSRVAQMKTMAKEASGLGRGTVSTKTFERMKAKVSNLG